MSHSCPLLLFLLSSSLVFCSLLSSYEPTPRSRLSDALSFHIRCGLDLITLYDVVRHRSADRLVSPTPYVSCLSLLCCGQSQPAWLEDEPAIMSILTTKLLAPRISHVILPAHAGVERTSCRIVQSLHRHMRSSTHGATRIATAAVRIPTPFRTSHVPLSASPAFLAFFPSTSLPAVRQRCPHVSLQLYPSRATPLLNLLT